MLIPGTHAEMQDRAWQLDTMGMPQVGAPGVRTAVIDTRSNAMSGVTSTEFTGSANDHGSLMIQALRASDGDQPTATAPGTPINFYPCGTTQVDLACALSALQDARTKGIKVVSMSFGVASAPQIFIDAWQEEVNLANNAGMLLFASSGSGPQILFPASLPGIISVRASDDLGNIDSVSATITVPGRNVSVRNGAGTLTTGQGSSFSTAQAAGIGARMLSLGLVSNSIRSGISGCSQQGIFHWNGCMGLAAPQTAVQSQLPAVKPVIAPRVLRAKWVGPVRSSGRINVRVQRVSGTRVRYVYRLAGMQINRSQPSLSMRFGARPTQVSVRVKVGQRWSKWRTVKVR